MIQKKTNFQKIELKKPLLNKSSLTKVNHAKVLRLKKSDSRDLYQKILGTITKKGKKSIAKKALNHSLFLTSRFYRIRSYKLINNVFKDLKCYVEIKKVVRRKNVTLIPFPLSKQRQRFLKIKWFLQGAKKNREKVSFAHKLYNEFAKIMENSKYLNVQRTEMNRLILKNVSNAHFRWVQKRNKK